MAAAAEIQRQIAEHNQTSMGGPLKVRIGLSAGNPVRKDEDYFGTVVQLAARLCAVAGTDEIAVSDTATRQPGCARFALSAPRTVALKGFKERQPIRMLFWHESSPASALENAA